MVTKATIKLTSIFKYFVDCFMLLLLFPAGLLRFKNRQKPAGIFLPFFTLYSISRF